MTYSSLQVANAFIELAEKTSGERLTNMKLQKLLYFAQGWHIAVRGKPLFNEQIEAWDYGPVVPTVYHKFSHRGAQPIIKKATAIVFDGERFVTETVEDIQDEEIKNFLASIWRTYGKHSALTLSKLTHAADTPWTRVLKDNGGKLPTGTDIPREYLRDYFESRRKAS